MKKCSFLFKINYNLSLSLLHIVHNVYFDEIKLMYRNLFNFTSLLFFHKMIPSLVTGKMSYKTRKRKEIEERKVNDGEQDNFFTDEMREEMETMWEVIKISHNYIGFLIR